MSLCKSQVLLLALAGLSFGAQAQKASPGLWETSMTIGAAGGEQQAAMASAQAQMAKMPPEQRKMMEEMMAKQGVALSADGMKTNLRYCLGKEQAERGDIPQDNEGRCKRDSVERKGATTLFKFSCSNPPSSGSGEVTMHSDKAYTMKMVVDRVEQGKTQRMQMQQSGKWLGADCGNLKPRGN